MGTIQMTNRDGTPFYADLSAESRVRITIGEAYQLIGVLHASMTFTEDLLNDETKDLSEDLHVTFSKMVADLRDRIDAIDQGINADKYAQWAAAAPAWAIRGVAR